MHTIYKNKQAKSEILNLYDKKLQSLNIEYENIDIKTQFGITRVIKAGKVEGKKIVLFHGYNAGAPLTLEAVKSLVQDYCFYAIDTIGQTTKSDETVLNVKDDSFAVWTEEVLKGLSINKAHMIGISYGAFILQKLIVYKPDYINTCIFVVPSGIVNSNFWQSTMKLTFPFIKYKITKRDRDLEKFLSAFAPNDNHFMMRLLKLIMTGVKMDTRIPKLLKRKQVENFNNPVYIIAASDDVYFPAENIQNRAEKLFNNLKTVYILKKSKHMPGEDTYVTIQKKIKEWIN